MKPDLLSVSEAMRVILAEAPVMPREEAALHSATGRILAETITADRDYPPINRSTMDGIAITARSWAEGCRAWKIETVIPAGVPSTPLRDALLGCAQIMTGAEVPEGCGGVIPFEDISLEGGAARARDGLTFVSGQNIHAKSHDRRRGDTLLLPGVRLDAPRIAILAAVGKPRVMVASTPRITILTTGDEVVPVDHPGIQPTQVRASNLAGLEAGLRDLGIGTVACRHVPDRREAILEAITDAIHGQDILILSGGVSKGTFDYVPGALDAAGVRRLFHGVAQKPGKPLWVGRTSTCHVFGLPGNPVSTLTVFRRYVVPFMAKVMGTAAPAPLMVTASPECRPHARLTLFSPVRLRRDPEDPMAVHPCAIPVEYHGSGDFAALAESEGFLEIPPGTPETIENRAHLPFYSWRT